MTAAAWQEVNKTIESLAVYIRNQMTDEDYSEETLTDNMKLLVRMIELSEGKREVWR